MNWLMKTLVRKSLSQWKRAIRFDEKIEDIPDEDEKLKKRLLEKKIAMEVMAQSVVGVKRTVIRLEREESLFVKKNKKSFFYSLQNITCGGRTTDKLLKDSASVFVECASNVEKKLLKYWERNFQTSYD